MQIGPILSANQNEKESYPVPVNLSEKSRTFPLMKKQKMVVQKKLPFMEHPEPAALQKSLSED